MLRPRQASEEGTRVRTGEETPPGTAGQGGPRTQQDSTPMGRGQSERNSFSVRFGSVLGSELGFLRLQMGGGMAVGQQGDQGEARRAPVGSCTPQAVAK